MVLTHILRTAILAGVLKAINEPNKRKFTERPEVWAYYYTILHISIDTYSDIISYDTSNFSGLQFLPLAMEALLLVPVILHLAWKLGGSRLRIIIFLSFILLLFAHFYESVLNFFYGFRSG